jgi:hypothetical protein
MKKGFLAIALALSTGLIASSALAMPQPLHPGQPMTKPIVVHHPFFWPNSNPVVYFRVVPHMFDPGNLFRATAKWESGLGCISDAGCPTGDTSGLDNQNQGLLFAKNLTSDNVAGFATTTVVHGAAPLEFGYDIRNGGNCGAGAPRFDVVTNDNVTHFIGCNSPPPTNATGGTSWTRMRWGDMSTFTPPPAFPAFLPGNTIKVVEIVFDEGADTGPTFSGDIIMDNIEVNGILVGRAHNP